LDDLAEKLGALAHPGDAVALSGSLPLGCPPDTYAQLVRVVEQTGAKAIVDTSGEALRAVLAAKPSMIKPNADEASQLARVVIDSPASAARTANRLRERFGIEAVVISLGAQGAVLASGAGSFWARPPEVAVENTVGSGDAFVAGFTTGWQEHSVVEALRVGVEVSSAAVMSEPTGFFDPRDLTHVRELGVTLSEL
jgi:tagatose 6-phosphate kinase